LRLQNEDIENLRGIAHIQRMDKDKKRRSPEAERALAEAEARREAAAAQPAEHGGPAGPEPTRYGDWERKGVATDF